MRYSPGVPGGAVGGATWSKNPPFSSHVTKSAVLAHTFGLLISVSSTWPVTRAPVFDGAGGCSSWYGGARTHDTDGSDAVATADVKSCG